MEQLAYLDAGSGSIMLQAMVGGVAGLAVTTKVVTYKIKRTLALRRPATASVEEQRYAVERDGA